jgi:hypothetical protein
MRTVRSLATAGALFAVAVVAPLTAQASLSQCTGSKVCVWGNNDYKLLIAAQAHGQGVVDPFNDANGENNQADSWQNRSNNYKGCLYDGGNGTGALLTMGIASRDNDVSAFDSDKASSMRTNRGC